jgi:hypothetical protein
MVKTLDFKFNGAVITVREEIGMDVFTKSGIHSILIQHLAPGENDQLNNGQWAAVIGYERILSRTVKVEGHLSVCLPSPNASNDEIIAGFNELMNAPADLVSAWKEAVEIVSKTPMEVQEGTMNPPE